LQTADLLHQRYLNTLESIVGFSRKHQRSNDSVRLVAVSKRHPAWKIFELARAGQIDFAENYLQEALEKINEVNEICESEGVESPLQWHFIGHIQSRKCREIAENFDWVHTVESRKVADKLNQHRTAGKPLNVLIQLNLQEESTKSGILPVDLEPLARHIASLKNLKLRGLMIIPKNEPDFEEQRAVFRQCRENLETLNQNGFELDQLSMGMSGDLEAAIAEGATQVRIGTAIFGPRPDRAPRPGT